MKAISVNETNSLYLFFFLKKKKGQKKGKKKEKKKKKKSSCVLDEATGKFSRRMHNVIRDIGRMVKMKRTNLQL